VTGRDVDERLSPLVVDPQVGRRRGTLTHLPKGTWHDYV